jgi:ribonuclease E
VTVNDEVGTYLNNKKRREIGRLEDDAKVTIQVIGRKDYLPEQVTFHCLDSQGREVRFP